MKIRTGFVSNSSTASFIVQTRPSDWDKLTKYSEELPSIGISEDKIELLKKHGFWPTKETNPFAREMGVIRGKTEDDTFLTFKISCNHDYVLQFLVANEIPFKAAVSYAQYLYTYDPKEECIYRLQNFGIKYMKRYKDLEKALNRNDEDFDWVDIEPLKKYSREDFLKDYDEEEALKIIGEPLTRE